MSQPRVKRSRGPKGVLTKHNYRKKTLPLLQKDFSGRCAYCLESHEFRHANQTHVDHFDCRLHGRRRHQYANLMLACSACNLSKHDKPVRNPLATSQRLLNCTKENEFPEHIVENDTGEWIPRSDAARYHIAAINLSERSHRRKRWHRRKLLEQIVHLNQVAIQYRGADAFASHNRVMAIIRSIAAELEDAVPMVTAHGLKTAREYLAAHGVSLA